MNCLAPTLIYDKKNEKKMLVPCGCCLPCRIRRRSEWTLRLMHEKEFQPKSCFVTLTYRDETVPPYASRENAVLFLQRLRNCYRGRKIKYFGCNEYGGMFGRPHHHFILFGVSQNECEDVLPRIWEKDFGFTKVEVANKATMRYVAGYVCDKLTPSANKRKYGEHPPTQMQSQGLGLRWAQAHKTMMEKDFFITYGKLKVSIPRYYLKKLFPKDDLVNQWFYEKLHEISVSRETFKFVEKCGCTLDEVNAFRKCVENGSIIASFCNLKAKKVWQRMLDVNFVNTQNIVHRMNMRRDYKDWLDVHDFIRRYYDDTVAYENLGWHSKASAYHDDRVLADVEEIPF